MENVPNFTWKEGEEKDSLAQGQTNSQMGLGLWGPECSWLSPVMNFPTHQLIFYPFSHVHLLLAQELQRFTMQSQFNQLFPTLALTDETDGGSVMLSDTTIELLREARRDDPVAEARCIGAGMFCLGCAFIKLIFFY